MGRECPNPITVTGHKTRSDDLDTTAPDTSHSAPTYANGSEDIHLVHTHAHTPVHTYIPERVLDPGEPPVWIDDIGVRYGGPSPFKTFKKTFDPDPHRLFEDGITPSARKNLDFIDFSFVQNDEHRDGSHRFAHAIPAAVTGVLQRQYVDQIFNENLERELEKVFTWYDDKSIELQSSVDALYGSMAKADMAALSEMLKSDGYFWLSKCVEVAYAASSAHYALILNSILSRYVDQIVATAGQFISAIRTAFARLVETIGSVFNLKRSDEVAVQLSHEDIDFQSGVGEHFQDFIKKATQLLSYMSEKRILGDLVRLVAIGLLAMYAYLGDDNKAFTYDNVDEIMRRGMSTFTTGTMGSFINVLSSMYATFSDYISLPPGIDLSDYLGMSGRGREFTVSGKKLLIEQKVWATLSVEQQQVWIVECENYMRFCEDALGAKSGWKRGNNYFKREPAVLQGFQMGYTTLSLHYTCINNGGFRKAPFMMALIGGSAIAKSTLQAFIGHFILKQKLGIPKKDHQHATYVWPGAAKYADGLTNGKKIIILDDIAAKLPALNVATSGDPLMGEIINMINNVAYSPNMADLESKGTIFVKPEMVIGSSNDPSLGIEHIYKYHPVATRRIKYFVYVKLQPEFDAGTGTVNGAAFAEAHSRDPTGIPNAWSFNVCKYGVRNHLGAHGHVDMEPTLEWLRGLDTPAFFRWLSVAFDEHQEAQLNVLRQHSVDHDWSFLEPDRDPDVFDDALEHQSGDAVISQATMAVGALSIVGVCMAFILWLFDFIRRAWLSSSYRARFIEFYGDVVISVDEVTQISLAGVDLMKSASALRRRYTRTRRQLKAWVDGALESLKRIAGVLAMIAVPILMGQLACSVHKRLTDGVSLQGGTLGKRRSVPPDEPTVAEVALLEPPPAVGDFTFAPGTHRPVFMHRTDVKAIDGRMLPRSMTQSLCLQKPIVGEDDWEVLDGPSEPISEHPVDRLPRYSDPTRPFCAMPTLTQPSLSVTGSQLRVKINEAMVDITFKSEARPGVGGLFTGLAGPVQDVYQGRGMFVRGTVMMTNRHYFPQCHPDRSQDEKWAKNWTLTLHGCGQGGKDIIMRMRDIFGQTLSGRDVVMINVPEARQHKDITKYFMTRPKLWDAPDRVQFNSFLPSGMPVSFIGRNHISPYGLVSETTAASFGPHANPVHKPSLFCRVFMDFETFSGDCGSPYVVWDKSTVRAIVGIHMAVVKKQPGEKLFVPIFVQDFDNLHEMVPIVAVTPEIVVPPSGTTPQDANDQAFSMQFNYKPGFTHNNGKRIHNVPALEPGIWGKKNESWVLEHTGLIVNPNSYLELGCRRSVTGNMTSSYFRSPLSEAYNNADVTGLPGPIATDKEVNNMGRTERNKHAAIAIGGIMEHPDFDPNLYAEFQEASDMYLQSILRFPEVAGHLKRYPLEVAINGRRLAGEDQFMRGVEPLAMSTSPGWPFVECPGPKGKAAWFNRDEEGNYSMGDTLTDSYQRLKAAMFEGDINVIYRMVPKDEVKKPAKATRMIMVGPLDMTILTREYLVCICRVMALFPFVFGATVGVDATSIQWEQLYTFVRGPAEFLDPKCGEEDGNAVFDGDYVNFDKRMLEELTRTIITFVVALCRAGKNFTDKELFMIGNLLRCMLSPVVDVFGVLYWFRSLNSSGNSLTTQLNCIAGMHLLWLAFIRRMKRVMGKNFCKEFVYLLFIKMIRALTYGDDNIVGTRVTNMFSCLIVQQELKGVMEYTDAHKNKIAAPYTVRKQLQFLGRNFVRDHRNRVLCPLEWKRITKMFHFYRKLPGLDFPQLIAPLYRGALMEVYFHGKAVYDTFFPIVVGVLSDFFGKPASDIVTIFLSANDTPLTWEFFDEWYSAKAELGYITDPRYEECLKDDHEEMEAMYAEYQRLAIHQ